MLSNRRSSSLLALTLVAIAGGVAAYAGPLQPSAGPIVSTHKTLTEVEPRIPISAATTPGDADSVFKITQRGSYYLAENMTVGSGLVGIEIATGGVTIDLNGFDILGTTGSLDGIRLTTGNQTSITIRNGNIRLMDQDGIDLLTTPAKNVRIENVHTSGNEGRGIAVSVGTIESCTANTSGAQGIVLESGSIRACLATGNDLTGILVTGHGATVTGCNAIDNNTNGIFVGESAVITNCVARGNGEDGITASIGSAVRDCVSDLNTVHGFVLGASSSIISCSAKSNGSNGIVANSNSMVMSNMCSTNGTAGLAAGIRLQGGNSRLEGNNCVSNPRGVDVTGSGNFIVKNTCAGNTTNWVIVANNAHAAIVNATAPASPAVNGNASAADELGSTNPNANFSY